jgi:hypothetical protein
MLVAVGRRAHDEKSSLVLVADGDMGVLMPKKQNELDILPQDSLCGNDDINI